MNSSSYFTTDKEWSDRDSMISWAKNVGLELHMVIVISKSWPNRKVILSCEKSGPYTCVGITSTYIMMYSVYCLNGAASGSSSPHKMASIWCQSGLPPRL